MRLIDDILNRVTMYRLVVYVLAVYAACGVALASFGRLGADPTAMILGLAVILLPAYLTDRGFGRLFEVPTNSESWLITGLILFLILPAPTTVPAGLALALAAALSSASKFLLARRGKHFFNPAALAAAFLSLWGFLPASWWIGSSLLWPVTLILGLAVARKIRRVAMVVCFVGVSTAMQAVLFPYHHQPVASGLKQALIASPLIFLATIMLTEPATMPPRRNLQFVFASLVAILYVGGWQLGPLIIYPEVALLLGNLLAYAVSPKFRVRLELLEIQRISKRVYNYVFRPDIRFDFRPGQYLEWTLAGVPYDSRGNRRTFTIASSPTEDTIQLGLKYYEPASAYKDTFRRLRPGDSVYGSQLAGNFTLNGNEDRLLAFIAGGIGITPFRSMVKYLTDLAEPCDITLLYLVSDPAEFAYVREFKAAAVIGVRTYPIVTDPTYRQPGVITATLGPDLIAQLIPDLDDRLFYVSGPNRLVDDTKEYLSGLGVPATRIRTDHFSGY